MGCDYYILKKLHIYYAEQEYLDIEVKLERGYFQYDGDIDSDDETADQQVNEYIQYILTPKMKPILIYDGQKWNKKETENKYKSLLDNTLKENNVLWEQIIKIIKLEERRER